MEKYKKVIYKSNKFKISVLIWNGEFELPAGSNSVSDIQDHFKNISQKMEKGLIMLQ